ncbi:MAG: TrkH family potassium uptake protein [Syntrophobacteraceae bacterium]
MLSDTDASSVRQPKARTKKISLSALILLSYVGAICAGAGILMLPLSTVSGVSLIDALFTATSAVCVTGLTVVDTGTVYTVFGQFVIMLLIQVGGLGVMTFTVVLFLYLGRKISFRQRMIMQEVFAHTPRQDIYRVVKSIFVFTFLVEGSGALSLFLLWIPDHSFFDSVRLAAFHSVSAFCNAGFGLFPDNFMSYRDSAVLNLTICGLIVLGGIGFPVVYDVSEHFKNAKIGRLRLSVQTKTVLTTTAFLILAGMGLILWTESGNVLKGVPWGERIWIALFQSVTTRTAGFNTVDIGQLTNPTLFTMMILMFWGASPGSTGGGVKTTTLAILSSFTWSRLRRKAYVNLFKKTVPHDTLSKSVSLVVLSLGFIFTIFFLVLFSQEGLSGDVGARGEFADYLFEVISAFGTVGLSTGVTPKLNVVGKLLIITMMLIGRVGVLTFTYIFAGVESRGGIQYAEQNLMIG